MKSKKDKFSKTFAFVLLLLAFISSVFIGAKGVILRINAYIESKKPKPIILHNFWEENKLWYYEPGTSNVMGTYDCNGKNIYCGFAYELIDDKSYALQYYDSNTQITYDSYIMGNYSFIIDAENEPEEGDTKYRNEKIKLLNIRGKTIEKEYGAVKSYGNTSGLNSKFIVRDLNGKWGVITITTTGTEETIPFQYDFIGLFSYSTRESPTITDKYVVKKGTTWAVIDSTGKEIISNIPEPIFGYEGTTVVTRDGNNKYNIYDATGNKLNNITEYNNVTFTETGYVLGETENYRYGIYDNKGNEIRGDQLFFKDDVNFVIEEKDTVFQLNGRELFRVESLNRKGLDLPTQ